MWQSHTCARSIPAALVKPLGSCCTLTTTKSPEVSNRIKRHGHTGEKEEFFGLHQPCGICNTCSTCLLGQGDAILPPYSASEPKSSLAPLYPPLPGFHLFTSLWTSLLFLLPNIKFLFPCPQLICSGLALISQTSSCWTLPPQELTSC